MELRAVRHKKIHRRQETLRWLSGSVFALVLVLLVVLGWFSPVYIADPSMEDTLLKGETVFYDRLYKHFYPLQRGDMVAFRDPTSGELLIKRIVALEGESIEMRSGLLVVDGKYAISESGYTTNRSDLTMASVKVPAASVFVLSDDRDYGEDSRDADIGCLAINDILGVVRFRIDRPAFFTH